MHSVLSFLNNLPFNYSLFQNLLIPGVDERLMDSENTGWEDCDWVKMAQNMEQ
jgi:hypothetical protein